MQLKPKYRKVINYLIKFSVLLFISWLLFNQLNKYNFQKTGFPRLEMPFYFILTILLAPVNIGSEYIKWKYTLNTIGTASTPTVRLRSFLSGFLTGFLTPNLLGNFIGRMFYFKRAFRPSIILLTLLSNAAQFIASILFGALGILWIGFPAVIPSEYISFVYLFCILSVLVAVILYFYAERLPISFLHRNKYIQKTAENLKNSPSLRWQFIAWSLFRHFVFSLQYYLLLKSFGLPVSFSWFASIWQVFLWTTLIPSVWFGKIGIRESVAVVLLTPLCNEPFYILSASVVLWIINQAFPSVAGIPFLTKKSNMI